MPRPAVIHCTSPGPSRRGCRAVLVPHVSVEHVGDGLEAAVRMRREARDVVVGIVGEELVEHQERVEAQVGRLPRLRRSFTPAPSDAATDSITACSACGRS